MDDAFLFYFAFLCFGGGWTGVPCHLLDLSSLFGGVGALRISRICVARPPLKRGRNYFGHGLLHGKGDFWVSWMIPLEFLVLAMISAGQGLGRCRGQENEGIRRRMRKGDKIYVCQVQFPSRSSQSQPVPALSFPAIEQSFLVDITVVRHPRRPKRVSAASRGERD